MEAETLADAGEEDDTETLDEAFVSACRSVIEAADSAAPPDEDLDTP